MHVCELPMGVNVDCAPDWCLITPIGGLANDKSAIDVVAWQVFQTYDNVERDLNHLGFWLGVRGLVQYAYSELRVFLLYFSLFMCLPRCLCLDSDKGEEMLV